MRAARRHGWEMQSFAVGGPGAVAVGSRRVGQVAMESLAQRQQNRELLVERLSRVRQQIRHLEPWESFRRGISSGFSWLSMVLRALSG